MGIFREVLSDHLASMWRWTSSELLLNGVHKLRPFFFTAYPQSILFYRALEGLLFACARVVVFLEVSKGSRAEPSAANNKESSGDFGQSDLVGTVVLLKLLEGRYCSN